MRRAPQGPLPAWRLVVRTSLEPALDTVRRAMGRGGYRLVSLPGDLPLVFRRGSVASYALLGSHLTRYSGVRVTGTAVASGLVALTVLQDRAQHPVEAADALETSVAAMVAEWSARGLLVTAERQDDLPGAGDEEAAG